MKWLILLALIVIAILLALFYFNKQSTDKELQEMRIAYEDSLRVHHEGQAKLKMEIALAERTKIALLKKDSATKAQYEKENGRLRTELRKARTPRVEEVIAAEPELRMYLLYYDSVLNHKDLRIDSLEIEKRIQEDINRHVANKTNLLLIAKEGENAFLMGEIDKRDEIIKKLKKQRRKERALGVLGWLLNLVPR